MYTKKIIVSSEHLDELGHVNNVQFLHWVQEIASEHWYTTFPESHINREYWVVLEHLIQYKGQAFIDNSLHLETFVESPTGIRLPRFVNFYLDNKLIVHARTVWCFIDAKTRKPKRISDAVLHRFGIKLD